MEDEKRVQQFLTLYKQQMQRCRDTQGVEWKANFGVWTLLAGAIYFAAQHSIHVTHFAAGSMCIGTFVIHAWWLVKIHYSEEADKELWVRYRREALSLLLGGQTHRLRHENYSPRTWWKETQWLIVETWPTPVLAAI